MNQEILKMPKVELHCHLDGSLTLASVREILGKDISPEELQVQPDCQNLAEYLQKFDLPIQCLQTPEGIKKASKNFLLDVAKENVRYVEVRFAPTCSVNDHMNYGTVIESVLDGLKEAKELVDGAPKVVKEAVSKAEAEDIKAKLEAEGAEVNLK